MSNMVVNTNILALNSHRAMKQVGNIQSKASERLSSGLKINSAADDAAGLAISEKMRAQIRGLDMASKNAQDGISLIQTAEGGMQEIDNMIQRIRELTVAVSNDTNEHNALGTGDRQKMQDEVDQLVAEIDSMAGRVEFNKKKVINGDYSDPVKMLGDISSKLAVAQANLTNATGIRDAARTQADAANADLNLVRAVYDKFVTDKASLDTALQTAIDNLAATASNTLPVNATTGVGAGATSALQGFAADLIAIKPDHLTESNIKDLVNKYFSIASTDSGQNSEGHQVIDGTLIEDLITSAWTGSLATGDLELTLAGTTTSTGDITAIETAINAIVTLANAAYSADANIKAFDSDATAAGFFNAAYTGGGYAAITLTATGNKSIAAGDMKNAADLAEQLNKVSITNAKAVGGLDAKQKEMDVYSEQVARYTNQIKLANERLTALGGQTPGLYFQVGANAGQGLQTSIGSVKSDILGIGDGKGVTTIDFLKATGADITNTLNVLDEALSYVTTERSKLGATQNRLEYTIKSLDISSENLSASESRIRDTDMAKEMMNLTKANVLQQAAVSMLAQANQAPQSVLQLLR